MFGHKSFLKIGTIDDASIAGLYKGSHELQSCSYGFSQGVNSDGKAQTAVQGGTIYITYPNIPPQEFINLMLDSRKYESGVIVICDQNDMPLEKVFFEQATCIGLDIDFANKGKNYVATKMVLQAARIIVGTTTLDNHWVQ